MNFRQHSDSKFNHMTIAEQKKEHLNFIYGGAVIGVLIFLAVFAYVELYLK